MGKSLFWKGVLYGAIAGGALTMLDRQTRENAAACCKKAAGTAAHYVKNPNEVIENVQNVSDKIKSAVQQVNEDIAFITGTVEELKECAPQAAQLYQQTKQAFSFDEQAGQSNHSEVEEWENPSRS